MEREKRASKYLGSVRFYRHLIVGMVLGELLLSTGLAVFWGVENRQLKSAAPVSVEQEQALAPVQMVLPDGVAAGEEGIAYQTAHPALYAEERDFAFAPDREKTVYLTFDDGPTQRTGEILDILDQYGVKATFFVVYRDDEASKELYREIVARGHTIGVHSASHDYRKVYQSVDSYLDDFDQMYQQIYEVTGVRPDLFRFPGGSVNAYNMDLYQEIIAEMLRRGFVYYDWNVGSGDTMRGATAATIADRVVGGMPEKRGLVLLHDSANKTQTVQALPQIIQRLQAQGYSFAPLNRTVRPCTFGYQSE